MIKNSSKKFINLLTALTISVSLFALPTFNNVIASTVTSEKFKTHVRWSITSPKDQLYINKTKSTVKLETLNLQLFEKMVEDLSKQNTSPEYFKRFTYDSKDYPTGPARIEIQLADENVELFSFYKEREKRYFLDFWRDGETAPAVKVLEKKEPIKQIVEVKAKPVVAKVKVETKTDVAKNLSIFEKKANLIIKGQDEYRDFRYGASFVWDYEPLMPKVEKIIDLENKTPEYFYPIPNREFDKDDKEAHMQLSINLYKKGKWGLMYKSIKLYDEKYGVDKNQDINDYLKANALLRSNIHDKNKGITNTANNIFINIIEVTNNYEMKNAIFKYLLQYYINAGDYIQVLQVSKNMYVASKENFDQETSIFAATVIINSLAQLSQIEKVQEFLKDPTIEKLMPKQVALAYLIYINMKIGDHKEVISLYENSKSGVVANQSSILFNVAEAYFKKAKYDKSIELYDAFLKSYSYISESSHARLRVALSYDLLDKDPKKILELYKSAINRSTLPEVRYEAKLRYVGMRIARKIKLDDTDLETLAFIDQTDQEQKVVKNDLMKLLWIVRLRTLIVQDKLKEALAYITSLPLNSLKPAESRTFAGDGAEIAYGLIKKNYDEGLFADAIKMWEVYKDKYVAKVALDSYLNFIVCDSYINLGLQESFKRSFERFKQLSDSQERTYPIWIKRNKIGSTTSMLAELEVIQLMRDQKWDKMNERLAVLTAGSGNFLKANYYKGLVSYNLKRYEDAKNNFEQFILSGNKQVETSPSELNNMILAYVDSVYQLNDQDKFREVAWAMRGDLQKISSPAMKDASEKVTYLLIESIYGENKTDFEKLDELTSSFLKDFDKSIYHGRVVYLRAKNFINNKNIDEGKRILQDIVKSTTIPTYIKDMAKTELSSIELWSRSI